VIQQHLRCRENHRECQEQLGNGKRQRAYPLYILTPLYLHRIDSRIKPFNCLLEVYAFHSACNYRCQRVYSSGWIHLYESLSRATVSPCRSYELSCFVGAGQPGPAMLVRRCVSYFIRQKFFLFHLNMRRTAMAYICQNCGVVTDDSNNLCNPVDEEFKSRLCSTPAARVCSEKASAIKYSCDCGNISANPQHLCHPRKIL